jgi:hypothetical protein
MGDVLSEVVILGKLHLENAVNLETQLGAAGTCAKQSKTPHPHHSSQQAQSNVIVICCFV